MSATERLYWQDPYCREFSAQVTERLVVDGVAALVLDRSCFYPTSGGQPNDTGTIEGVRVQDVIEQDGRILHLLSGPLEASAVSGAIDWPRRFDHMQQHTGQHILSQAFYETLGAETISFHLGAEDSTIDVSMTELVPDDLHRVEDLANKIVYEHRPVLAREYGEDQIAAIPLRKPPQVHGRIRVIQVQDFDYSACGGTHVATTGEVGMIHVRRLDRQRGATRVVFLCGWRALGDYRTRDATTQAVASRLSVGTDELTDALDRLIVAEQEARRQAASLRERVLEAELPRLAAQSERVGGWSLVCQVLEDFDAGNMRYLAQQLIHDAGTVVLLAVLDPSPQICFARSEDVPVDMPGLLRGIIISYGGRGGGRPHMAQGGGVDADSLPSVLAEARKRIGSVADA